MSTRQQQQQCMHMAVAVPQALACAWYCCRCSCFVDFLRRKAGSIDRPLSYRHDVDIILVHGTHHVRQVLVGEDWRRKLSVLRQIRDQLATEEGELGEDEMRELATFMVRYAQARGIL